MTEQPDFSGGVCIALIPSHDSSKHLTLGYFGETDNTPYTQKFLLDTVEALSYLRPPAAKVNGVGYFTTPDGIAVVDLVDSKDIGHLRNLMITMKAEPISEHGFIPHMTQSFHQASDFKINVIPINQVIDFFMIELWYGKDRKGFTFTK